VGNHISEVNLWHRQTNLADASSLRFIRQLKEPNEWPGACVLSGMTALDHQPRTLIADDQPHVVEALRLLLKHEGIQADAAQSPAAVLDQVKARPYDVLLMDLNYARDTTSGEEGLDLIEQVQAIDNTLPVVAMTAWGSVELAVEAMKRGVCDFVLKPWENSRLTRTLWNQIEKGRSKRDQLRRQREDDEAERVAGRALLPQSLPRIPGIDIAASVQPLATLSGDYFDVLEPAEGMLGLVIADAIGKGVPAALLMSTVQAGVRALAGNGFSPAELAASLNRSVQRNTTSGKFVTFFYGELETKARSLAYTNAGHCPPVLIRADGQAERLETGGAVLGVIKDWPYEQGRLQLTRGDRLLFFTDGITEAANGREDQFGPEQFGEDRLIELARALRHRPAQEIKDRILAAVSSYCGGRAEDDVTLVVVAVAD
jgi:sigma-B regulation protein RsbU (phosphoserine phosphatase)